MAATFATVLVVLLATCKNKVVPVDLTIVSEAVPGCLHLGKSFHYLVGLIDVSLS